MMEHRSVIRSIMLMLVATLFIVQQIYDPLSTIFLPIGEYFHSISYLLLAELLWINRGLKGISVKTQALFYVVHWTRYFDAFYHPHRSTYILSLKLWYMGISLVVLVGLFLLRHTYEREKDTASTCLLLVVSFILGTINHIFSVYTSNSAASPMSLLWTVSHYVQGFAMLPQFIFCYRDPDNNDGLLLAYILSLGGYRVMYAFNWISRLHHEKYYYISGPLGLSILGVFLGDFILYKLQKRSCISDFVLRLDDRVDELQQPLMSTIYRVSYNRMADAPNTDGRPSTLSHQYREPPHTPAVPEGAGELRVAGALAPPRLEPMEISLHSMDEGRRRSDEDDAHAAGGAGYEDEDDEGFYDNYERRNNRRGYGRIVEPSDQTAGGRPSGGGMYDLQGGGDIRSNQPVQPAVDLIND
eukprot:GHVS01005591.1.p1 GENE.GHVS01005591.1~~GHVS01005591.1.p1  ORF type:complete len:413 (-),score=61.03 GHVS01005591.1:1248-2486(-)